MTYEQALKKTKTLCSRQEKCKFDIRMKLRQWAIEDMDAAEITDTLVSEKYIDENRYANSFTNDKLKFHKWGKMKIRQALQQRNIEKNAINNALNNINEDQYKELINNELNKKLKSLENETDQIKKQNKLLQFAYSRGYESGIIFSLTEKICK